MKTSKAKALQILAIVMVAVLSCFIFTGRKVMAIIDYSIDEIFQIPVVEDDNEKNLPKLNRRERKEAEEIAKRLKMLKK